MSAPVIAMVVAIILVGIAGVLGGTMLMIQTMRIGSAPPSRRRRR